MNLKESSEYLNILRKSEKKFAISKGDVVAASLCTFLNPYSYLMLRAHSQVLENFDVIGVDGFSLAVFLRLAGVCNSPRVSFDMTSVAMDVFKYAEATGRTVFLVGSTQENLDTAVQHILARFPALKFCGASHGFFDDEGEAALIAGINWIGADIVICGMGAVKQEKFLAALNVSGWQGKGYSCGGFIHQIAKGSLDYYPQWMNRLNLRWIFRILDEPKLLKRYFIDYPIAIGLLLRDAVNYHILRVQDKRRKIAFIRSP